jgi:acyl-CoA synthetase (NDP forming)
VVVDRLGLRGLAVSRPTPAFIAAMAAQGVTVRDAPIIDLTLAATSAKYEAVLRGLLAADFCDAVLAVVGTSAQYQPQLAVQPILRAAVSAGKPLAVFLAPQADASLGLLAASGVAAFRTPEACADALAGVLTRRAPRAATAVDDGLGAALAPLFAAQTGGGSGAARPPVFDEERSLRIFDALGVPTVARALLVAPPWTHAVPYPVAVKLVSEDLPHKTEAGAVRLDVRDDAALTQAIAQMNEAVRTRVPGARVRGVLVQSMRTSIAEALVGYRHDVSAGPVVMLGAGGRLAELLRDVSLRMAPVDFDEARRMVEEVAALAPARGYRGMARGDVDALARVIVALGRLATLPGQPVAEAEINPVLVQADGVVAVDGLVVLRA